MKKLAVVSVIGGALLLAGCVGVGNSALRNETESSVKAKITEGVTTKSQVRALFGSPDETTFTDQGKEIWHYNYAKMHSDAVNYIPVVSAFGTSASGTKKELVIIFDNDDKVFKYAMSESAQSMKSGIFR